MQEEADQQTGAGRPRRTSSRKAYRNGHLKRTLKTRHGELTLTKPQMRDISFQTKVFERFSRTEKAVENAILESYLQGVSTRKIQEVVSHHGVVSMAV
jgi:putative transposase